MMLALWLWACTCRSDHEPTMADIQPSIDRSSVQGATCYRGEDGTYLELFLSAGDTASGVLTRPETDPLPLKGRRSGRQLDFGSVQVELLGRTVALVDGSRRALLESSGCP
ncbi:MAG: hypothetical protein R3F61_09840 [Myxococcota bacterium]